MIPPAPYLLCRIGGDRLALEAARVREVLPLLPVWRPPTLPPPLAGFVRLRGEVLAVLAPAVLFGRSDGAGPIDAFAHLVRPIGEGAACLLVERVEDLVSPAPEQVSAVDEGASEHGAIVAEIALDDGTAHLLSLDRLLTEAERARIAALAEAESRREDLWAGQGAA